MAKSFDELVTQKTTKKVQGKAARRAQQLLAELSVLGGWVGLRKRPASLEELAAAYIEMSSDDAREAEADEWCEALGADGVDASQ